MAAHEDPIPPVEVEAEPEDRYASLDPETRARRDAALRLVRKYGDPSLKSRALEVERFDDALLEEVRRMGQLMHDALGIGLAATQLGVMHRVLVYRVDPDGPVCALVNPVLEWSSEDAEALEEGCLSLPERARRRRPADPRPRARAGRARRADHDRGVRPRGAGHPARDGPPRRCPDPRPHLARPAQAGDAHAARGGEGRAARRGLSRGRAGPGCGRSISVPRSSPRSCSSASRARRTGRRSSSRAPTRGAGAARRSGRRRSPSARGRWASRSSSPRICTPRRSWRRSPRRPRRRWSCAPTAC